MFNDLLDSLRTFTKKNNFLKNIQMGGSLKKELTSAENVSKILIIMYIVIFTLNKPDGLINLMKKPLIQIAILGYILYKFNDDPLISLLLTIAYVITVTTDDNSVTENKNIAPIINAEKETFVGKNTNDESDNEESDEESDDEESDDEESDNEESDDEESDNEESDGESDNEESDEESDNEENVEKFKDSLFTNNNINDTFKNLHDAIHNLENFMNSSKK